MTNPRIRISKYGPEFSRIALGLWRLTSWQRTAGQRLEYVQQALDLGITTIDHADIYGSEFPFGEALSLSPSLRDRTEIVTKCGIVSNGERSYYDTSARHIIDSLENSLRLLRTDYVDLLLIHRPDHLMQIDEVAAAFQRLHESGKVRYFGVSNFTPGQFNMLASRYPLVTNQVEWSPLHINPLDDGTFDQCQQLAISPMIWSALAGGRLFSDQSARAKRVRDTLSELALRYAVSPTTIVYAWLLAHPSNPVVLTGSGRLDAIKEAFAALEVTLSRADWFAIWRASTGTPVP